MVAVPSDRGFLRALKGHFGELGSIRQWGMEGIEADSADAAQRMLEAIDETWRLMEMGWPDLMYQSIDEVESLLRDLIQSQCCMQDPWGGQGATGIYEDGDAVPDEITSAGYTTGSTDYTGFDDYKCMIAHVAVQDVAAKLDKLATLYDGSGLEFVGEIGAITGIITAIVGIATGGAAWVIFGGMVAAVGIAAEIWEKVITSTAPDIADLADDVLANEDALACAIYQADGSEAAVTAFNAKVDELFSASDALMVKYMTNNASNIRALYTGRYDQESVAQKLADLGYSTGAFSCSGCNIPAGARGFDLTYTFESDQNWTGLYTYNATQDWMQASPTGTETRYANLSKAQLGGDIATAWGDATPDNPYVIRLLEYDVGEYLVSKPLIQTRAIVYFEDTTTYTTAWSTTRGSFSHNVTEKEIIHGSVVAVRFEWYANGSTGTDGAIYIDNVRLEGYADVAP